MSGGVSKSQNESEQKVWKPWGEATAPILGRTGEFADPAMDAISNPQLQQDLQQWNQGIKDPAIDMWQNQAGGGNLAGYDIAGALAGSMGQNNQINPQQYQAMMGDANLGKANTYQANQVNANQVGQVKQSWADQVYQDRVGPDGSASNMNDMYRRQAGLATQDMLGATDARAAASGMSGGSRHGTAIGRGMDGINANLQNQMATTSYDAYNRDLDRHLNIASQTDQFNQQRALSDQGARNQFRAMNSDAKNQARAYNASVLNQQGQFNQSALNQQGQLNQQASNAAAQANQGTDLAAQQQNQQYSQQQQQLMQQLIGMQNQNQQGALGQTGAMMGLGRSGYQEALAPFSAYSQLLQGMGPSTVLSNSEGSSIGVSGGI